MIAFSLISAPPQLKPALAAAMTSTTTSPPSIFFHAEILVFPLFSPRPMTRLQATLYDMKIAHRNGTSFRGRNLTNSTAQMHWFESIERIHVTSDILQYLEAALLHQLNLRWNSSSKLPLAGRLPGRSLLYMSPMCRTLIFTSNRDF